MNISQAPMANAPQMCRFI